MRRLSTPTHTFSVTEVPLNTVSAIRVSYQQGSVTVVEKTEDDVTTGTNSITVKLTQADTKALKEGPVDVQLRLLTNDGTSLVSDIFYMEVEKTINDEVLTI